MRYQGIYTSFITHFHRGFSRHPYLNDSQAVQIAKIEEFSLNLEMNCEGVGNRYSMDMWHM